MRYESFQFRFPPRPGSKSKIAPATLPKYEKDGWWAQIKKNGTGGTLAIDLDRQIIARKRTGERHLAWQPNEDNRQAFLRLPGKGWYLFCAELMHSKVPGIRSINFINDILVADGDELVGMTFAQRQALLSTLFTPVGETFSHFVIDANTWLAKNFTSGFLDVYESLEGREKLSGMENRGNEGLVLKKPQALLKLSLNDTANGAWQIKARRETKVLEF